MPFASMDELRAARNAALAASDFLLLEDAPYPKENRQIVLTYREELRDLPQRALEFGLENTEIPDYSVFFRYPPREAVGDAASDGSLDPDGEAVVSPGDDINPISAE